MKNLLDHLIFIWDDKIVYFLQPLNEPELLFYVFLLKQRKSCGVDFPDGSIPRMFLNVGQAVYKIILIFFPPRFSFFFFFYLISYNLNNQNILCYLTMMKIKISFYDWKKVNLEKFLYSSFQAGWFMNANCRGMTFSFLWVRNSLIMISF